MSSPRLPADPVDGRLAACCVSTSARLVDAMRVLDRGGAGIALVTDETHRLTGTLTDGDVRRALLNGALVESPLLPFVRSDFTSVSPEASRAEVLDLMQSLLIRQIPVLDDAGRLLGLHLLHEILGAVERENWAVVMAGGRGSRLDPITNTVPKPMIRVAGRPILERLVLHLVSFGIRRVFLSINYLGHLVEEHFGDGSRLGCRVEYLREDQPLGTAGALSLLPEKPNAPIVVMNGDLITQADLGSMLLQHSTVRPMATLGVKSYFHTVPFGCVETVNRRVIRVQEKPQLTLKINAGIYILAPEVVARVSPGRAMAMTVLIDDCLARGEDILAFEVGDDWIDVGQRRDLGRATGQET